MIYEMPEEVVMARCPNCGFKSTFEPNNTALNTGSATCPNCDEDERLRPIAKYEKVDEVEEQNLVDQFFREPHADGATYYAKRGKTAIKAVDWDEDKDRLYPVVPEMEKARNRDWGFEEVDREEVPDHIEEYLENQFTSPQELAAALNSFGGKNND